MDTGTPLAAYEGFDPYSDTGWNPFKAIGSAVKTVGKGIGSAAKAVAPIVGKALPLAQTVLKNMGPVGMVASGAMGAMRAGLSGKSLEEIAWSAAEGAAPSGIDAAIRAAKGIRHGRSPVAVGLEAAASAFKPGSDAARGFSVAKSILGGGSPTKAALGAARRRLASEEARRAFDAAVGTVARRADPAAVTRSAAARLGFKLPTRAPTRALTRPDPLRGARRAAGTIVRRATMHRPRPSVAIAHAILRRNPVLATRSPLELAQRTGISARAARAAQTLLGRRFRFFGLRRDVGAMVIRFAPNYPTHAVVGDTSGLDAGGATYTVDAGDFPFKIAKALTGDGNRWRELVAANIPTSADGRKKKRGSDGNFTTLFAGEVLHVPPSWRKPAQSPEQQTVASILQAKAILATWGKTDGQTEAGPTDYGQRAEDLSTTFGPRDSLMLRSYANWHNERGRTPRLEESGELSPEHVDALRTWATEKATSAAPAVPGLPGVTPVIDVPGITIEAKPPAGPASPDTPISDLPVRSPGFPQIPGITAPAPTAPTVPLPTLPAPTPPRTVPTGLPAPTPAPTTTTAKKGDNDGLLIAAAALAIPFLLG